MGKSRFLRPRGQVRSGVLAVCGLVVLLGAVLAVLDLTLDDVSRLNDLAGLVQSTVTVLAIVAGGVFAYYKLRVFRDFEPHLTISHTVSSRVVGDSYVHIAVTATLHNGSRVEMEIREGFCRIQQVAPVSDEDVEHLYAQVLGDDAYLQWPTLDEVRRGWDRDELIVEPGESHPETFEFIVSGAIESVVIYTYFYNSRYPQPPQGWAATTVYDIMGSD